VTSALLLIWGLCLAGATALWGVSLARRDVSLVDIFWGPAFAGATLVAWLLARMRESAEGGGFSFGAGASPWQLLHLVLVAVWGLRLGLHIARRGRGRGEDRRYARMRADAGPGFRWTSLFKVFWLQATLVAVLAAPLAAVQLRPVTAPGWCAAGAVLWLLGFASEAVADTQLLAFQGDAARRGQVLASGLWRFSRHPNYFGEALLWWGFGVFALGVPGGLPALYAPLLMTVLLLRVSGVPLLEAGMAERRPGYRDYVARTSSFVPWPPRRPAALPAAGETGSPGPP
jgi:steroid 5-alpha reductase family enzyme